MVKKKKLIPKIGDKVVVYLEKANCTATGIVQDMEDIFEDGNLEPVVKITALDGKGFSHIWEEVVQRQELTVLCGMHNILQIIE